MQEIPQLRLRAFPLRHVCVGGALRNPRFGLNLIEDGLQMLCLNIEVVRQRAYVPLFWDPRRLSRGADRDRYRERHREQEGAGDGNTLHATD